MNGTFEGLVDGLEMKEMELGSIDQSVITQTEQNSLEQLRNSECAGSRRFHGDSGRCCDTGGPTFEWQGK